MILITQHFKIKFVQNSSAAQPKREKTDTEHTISPKIPRQVCDRAKISNPVSWILFQWFHDKSSSGGKIDKENTETQRLA